MLRVKPSTTINLIPMLSMASLNYVLNKIRDRQGKDYWVEFGVYKGRTINQIASVTKGTVYGFDSFEGLPEDWVNGFGNHDRGRPQLKGEFTLDGNLPEVRSNVRLIKGWFDTSLPEFIKKVIVPSGNQVGLIHIDSDLYSSAKTVLESLYPYMKEECYIVFDELINYPGYEDHEIKAFDEFIEKYDVEYKWIGQNRNNVAVLVKKLR